MQAVRMGFLRPLAKGVVAKIIGAVRADVAIRKRCRHADHYDYAPCPLRNAGLPASNSQQTMEARILRFEVIDKPIAHCMPQCSLIIEELPSFKVIHNVS